MKKSRPQHQQDSPSHGKYSTAPTLPILNPSAVQDRASAHCAMALAVLHADSNSSNRLRRYTHRMIAARVLAADVKCQRTILTRNPRTPLADLGHHLGDVCADYLNREGERLRRELDTVEG